MLNATVFMIFTEVLMFTNGNTEKSYQFF